MFSLLALPDIPLNMLILAAEGTNTSTLSQAQRFRPHDCVGHGRRQINGRLLLVSNVTSKTGNCVTVTWYFQKPEIIWLVPRRRSKSVTTELFYVTQNMNNVIISHKFSFEKLFILNESLKPYPLSFPVFLSLLWGSFKPFWSGFSSSKRDLWKENFVSPSAAFLRDNSVIDPRGSTVQILKLFQNGF